jgi:hypothetical protein
MIFGHISPKSKYQERGTMMSKIFIWGLVLFIAALASPVFAQPPHPATGEPLIVTCDRGTPTLDGVLNEWGGDVAVLDVAEQADADTWGGPADCSATFYSMWDDTNIYIGVEVTDDAIVTDQTGGSIWKNDCAEILFGTTNAVEGHDEHYQYGITPNGLTYNWCNCEGVGQREIDYVELATSETGSGYIMECAIPYSEMPSLSFTSGNTIGYNVCVDDSDGPDENPAFQLSWHGLGAHTQTQGFGHLVFTSDPVTAVSASGKLATTWSSIKIK